MTHDELEAAHQDMQALSKLAEHHRRERATMSTAPIKGLVDYATGGVAVDQGWAHLNESIVHGQRQRTEAAAELVVRGLYHTLEWLRAAGYDVPTILGERAPAPAPCEHVLYTTADADRPSVICDANGDVVLAMCKLCGKAEAELLEPVQMNTDNMARRGWATKGALP